MPYVLIGDSNSDFPYDLVDRYSLSMIHMPYLIDGEEHFADLGRDPRELQSFYDAMKRGSTAKTSLLPESFYEDYFRPYLQRGHDILYISFSFQLSQTQANAQRAADMLLEEYPERVIRIVDSKSISMGHGLLLYYACELYENGRTMDEVERFIMDSRHHVNHWFTVDDLVYLKRGGRLSATSAFVGTLLDVKPILTVNLEGKLVPAMKVKGRRKAIRTLADKIESLMDHPEEQVLIIENADCLEDAQLLELFVRQRVTPKDVWHVPVGQVITTHAGPGTLAVIFMGKHRES